MNGQRENNESDAEREIEASADDAADRVSSMISRELAQQREQKLLEKAHRALRMVTPSLPHLTRLAHAAQLRIDSRIDTAAITPSGRLLFNPQFLGSLTLADATFVAAHELYHLVLQTHERGDDSVGWLVNIAHDLIINDNPQSNHGVV